MRPLPLDQIDRLRPKPKTESVACPRRGTRHCGPLDIRQVPRLRSRSARCRCRTRRKPIVGRWVARGGLSWRGLALGRASRGGESVTVWRPLRACHGCRSGRLAKPGPHLLDSRPTRGWKGQPAGAALHRDLLHRSAACRISRLAGRPGSTRAIRFAV